MQKGGRWQTLLVGSLRELKYALLCYALFSPDKTIRFNHVFGPKRLWGSNLGTHAYFAYFCSKQWKPPKVHYSEPQMVGGKKAPYLHFIKCQK